MSHLDINSGQVVANASENERTGFIKRTYMHVAGALATLAVLEFLLLQSGIGQSYFETIQATKWYGIIALVVFIAISYVAHSWAHSDISKEKQYLGLGVYIVALAVFFLPTFYMANTYYPGVLGHAFLVTTGLVAGITYTAFTSKINFSFMGKYLYVAMFVLLGVAISGMLFGFSLGLWFSAAAVLVFAGFVLFDTSKIIHEYHSEQYVGAALALFSSIAFLFINVVQLFMGMGSDD